MPRLRPRLVRARDAWRRFVALDTARQRLLLEAAFLLAALHVALRVMAFGTVRGRLEALSQVPVQRRHPAAAIGWAVRAAATQVSRRPSCLVEALVADLMLRRRGYRSMVKFGVRKPDGHGLDGHAWVECEGIVVIGVLDDLGDYGRLMSGCPR